MVTVSLLSAECWLWMVLLRPLNNTIICITSTCLIKIIIILSIHHNTAAILVGYMAMGNHGSNPNASHYASSQFTGKNQPNRSYKFILETDEGLNNDKMTINTIMHFEMSHCTTAMHTTHPLLRVVYTLNQCCPHPLFSCVYTTWCICEDHK